MKIDFSKVGEAAFICLDGKLFRIACSTDTAMVAKTDDGNEHRFTEGNHFESISYFRLEMF